MGKLVCPKCGVTLYENGEMVNELFQYVDSSVIYKVIEMDDDAEVIKSEYQDTKEYGDEKFYKCGKCHDIFNDFD